MLRIPVRTPSRSYDVVLGSGLLARAGEYLGKLLANRQVFVVTVPPVRRRWGKILLQSLADAGFSVIFEHVPGDHWDDPNANGPDYPGCHGACPGTTADLQTHLLPHIDDGWLAPAS